MWGEVLRLAAAGEVTPRVHAVYSMHAAREACAQLQERLNIGKVVLACNPQHEQECSETQHLE